MFSLGLVEKLFGDPKAEELASLMMLGMVRYSSSPFPVPVECENTDLEKKFLTFIDRGKIGRTN